MEDKTIYDLGLNHSTRLTKSPDMTMVRIWRVPGGWIYQIWDGDNMTSNFVPFDNEFQLATKEKP